MTSWTMISTEKQHKFSGCSVISTMLRLCSGACKQYVY